METYRLERQAKCTTKQKLGGYDYPLSVKLILKSLFMPIPIPMPMPNTNECALLY